MGGSATLTHSQRRLLHRVVERSPLPIDEAASEIDDARHLIASGYITMKVVQYPWGLNFELVAIQRMVGGDVEQ